MIRFRSKADAEFLNQLAVRLKYARFTVLIDQQYIVRIAHPAVFGSIHPRGAARHCRHRKTDCLPFLIEQTVDFSGRYVSFDYVTRDFGGVARAKPDWHPQSLPCVAVTVVETRGRETISFEMTNPVNAAAAGRAFPDLDGNRRCDGTNRHHADQKSPGKYCSDQLTSQWVDFDLSIHSEMMAPAGEPGNIPSGRLAAEIDFSFKVRARIGV